jgi:thiol-disulfide isomerase/thioredoxin
VWASWCLPCQKELPELQRLHQLAGSRLLVLGVVSEDDQRDALDLLAHVGAHYPSVIDATGAKVHRLGLPGLPGSFLISTGGRIAKTYIGGLPALPQLEADIVHVLGVRV